MIHAADLRRTIGASLERVWENVLDWEHLPWLHRSSFESIELIEAGEWGWRARTGLTNSDAPPVTIELLVDRPARRYVSRTLDGRGAGIEIWTGLDPCSEGSASDEADVEAKNRTQDRTDIRVEFWLPAIVGELAGALGQRHVALYETLWDEDESMMRERTAQLEQRAEGGSNVAEEETLHLGDARALRSKLPLLVELGGHRYRIALVDGQLVAHSAVCPHKLGPLDGSDSIDVASGQVRCPWHGYIFDMRSGLCENMRGLALAPAPRIEIDPAGGSVTLRHGVTPR
jgi:nitrite reductase/ring-hydroxylating ferredoxin subunit